MFQHTKRSTTTLSTNLNHVQISTKYCKKTFTRKFAPDPIRRRRATKSRRKIDQEKKPKNPLLQNNNNSLDPTEDPETLILSIPFC
jgi:hypothetical protein